VLFSETAVPGVWIVTPEPKEDFRGFLARTWCDREFEAVGICQQWVQSSISFNKKKGTLRGMHYQRPPYAEAKLIRCTRGRIHDVVLDLRRDTPTFKRHIVIELSAMNRNMVYIPHGLAHGFQTLEDDTEVLYQMSEFYAPGHDAGVRWNDPAFGIVWPESDPILSERDSSYPDFHG
jgi:dTDP-4-dehydrorhamnose 3,5-epimerase